MPSVKTEIRRIAKILLIISVMITLFSLALLIPQVRDFIIHIGEKYTGRNLSHEIWHENLIAMEKGFLKKICIAICFLCYYSFSTYPIFYKTQNDNIKIKDELKNIKNAKTLWMYLIIVFTILLGIRLFYISQKKSMHVDEGLSIAICNRNEYGFWGKNYELNHQYTGEELKNMSLWDNPDVTDAFADIFHMHQNNRDSPHTNLYYSFFRLWFTGDTNNNLNHILKKGCMLNLIFFTISFLFMVLLLRRFSDSNLIISIILLLAFITPQSISLTLFLRPYELQQTFIIILTYYVTCVLQTEFKNGKTSTKENFISGVAILSFTMLAAYLNIIIIGFYGLTIIIMFIRKKNWNLLNFFITIFITSLVIAKLLYFNFGNMGYRGMEAASKMDISNTASNLHAIKSGIMQTCSRSIPVTLYYASIFILCIINLIRYFKNGKNTTLTVVITISALSFWTIIYYVPTKTFHYTAPLCAVFALNFITLTEYKKIRVIIPALFLLVLASEKNRPVDHLDDTGIKNFSILNELKNLPVFVSGNTTWKYSCLIPYLPDGVNVTFVTNLTEILEHHPDSFPCVFINQNDESMNIIINDGKTLKKLSQLPYHTIYSLEEK